MNLARMNWLKQFCPSVGFSDHTSGTEAAKVAMGMGAEIVEKHFTTDRLLPGKDQQVSGLPFEFRELRAHAEQVEILMGTAHTSFTEAEDAARAAYIGKWGDNR